MILSWQAHLKACSTSVLGNTLRFRGHTTPDKIPSVMISCKTFFNSVDVLNILSSVTPWKLVSFRNIFMPVSWESMTDAINVTEIDYGYWTQGPTKCLNFICCVFSCLISLLSLSLRSLLSHLYSVSVTEKKFSFFTALSVWCLSR